MCALLSPPLPFPNRLSLLHTNTQYDSPRLYKLVFYVVFFVLVIYYLVFAFLEDILGTGKSKAEDFKDLFSTTTPFNY